jgi:hypothetical protein
VNPFYPLVARRSEHRCEYCRAPEVISNFRYEVEHINPQAQGGTDSPDNLALACRACNIFKSAAVEAIDPTTGEVVPLFHPRQNRWSDHFDVDTTTGLLHGKTTCGRATVARLQMNSDMQREARLIWMRLGLFP